MTTPNNQESSPQTNWSRQWPPRLRVLAASVAQNDQEEDRKEVHDERREGQEQDMEEYKRPGHKAVP